ncbi:MAG: hypothetical protein HY741_03080 [Chloroflexi bacterium]|nr:hypothetical protein [Chloroflexota bacterium]
MSVNLRRAVFASANVNSLYPVLALLVSIFAIAPLWYPGFFQSHTGYAAVYNLIDLDQHLGNLLTWIPTWGRAFDLLRMDGPLAYWLAELFHLFGLSYLGAIKLVYALAFGVSAYAMFVVARRVLQNDAGALLAATIYLYFPYHIALVYQRGAFGEAVAYALFPLALLALRALQSKANPRALILGALAMLLLTLTQAGLSILFGIFAVVWLWFLGGNNTRPVFLRAIAAIVVGVALGLALRAPSIFAQAQVFAPNGFVPAFVYPFQFLTATWGNAQPRGVFTPERAGEEAAYQIGIAALGFTILALALLFRNGRAQARSSPMYRVAIVNVLLAAVLIVSMTPWVEPLWSFTFGFLVQYPFQLLTFVGLSLAFVAGSMVITDERFADIPLLAALVIVPVLAVYPYLAPQYFDLNPTKPALARFNDELALLDAKITRPPGVWRHGATVEIDLTWQALKQPNRDYTVFLHIVDENGKPWGATDEKPQGAVASDRSALSTLKLVQGQIVSDTHAVQIDLKGPPEGYHIRLGIYPTATGQPAPTETGATEIRIEENK